MSEGRVNRPMAPFVRPPRSVDELLAAKDTRPILSVGDLGADTFESDEELDEFLRFMHEERQHDIA